MSIVSWTEKNFVAIGWKAVLNKDASPWLPKVLCIDKGETHHFYELQFQMCIIWNHNSSTVELIIANVNFKLVITNKQKNPRNKKSYT